jgi:hypothetical protein
VFTVGYLAFSVPAIAAGIAAGHIGLERTAQVYGIGVIVLALLAVAGLALRARRPAPLPASSAAQSAPKAANTSATSD